MPSVLPAAPIAAQPVVVVGGPTGPAGPDATVAIATLQAAVTALEARVAALEAAP